MESNPFTLAGAVRSAILSVSASAATHQMDGFGPPDQDDFWLLQPKTINLIAFKAAEQLYGFN
jgi:hypothetical protein